MMTDDIIRELKAIKGDLEIISESADPRLVDEIYNAGLNIKPVTKFQGSINAGIMKMQQFKIHVTSRSVNFRKEFNNYTWQQDKEGKWRNVPIDMWNHCFTGDTLVLTDKGLKRIDSIKVGDYTMTSQGYRRITNLFIQGCRKVLVVRFCFNDFVVEIQATPEHKIKTKNGWKELQNLTTNDTIYLSKYLTEKNITFIVEKGISRAVHTDCTVMYGYSTTEKFQKDATYIIKTRIPTITISKTLKWLKATSICIIMRKSLCEMKHALSRLVKTCVKRRKQQRDGIIPQKGKNGIDYTAYELLQAKNLRNTYACAAEKNSWQSQVDSINFVQTNARANGVGCKVLTMRNECVDIAEKRSLLTNIAGIDSVVEVVPEKIVVLKEYNQLTYDIEVDDMHEFFANGVLVHNCMDATRYVVLDKVLGAYGSGMSASDILGII